MPSFSSILQFIALCQTAHSHMLWQQQIVSSTDSRPMTIYTFAEKPGLSQVEAERMSQKAYDKGIKAHIQTESGDSELDICLDGKYLKARMSPYSLYDHEGNDLPYALESYVDWGTYGEHGPPSLIRFYTSASHVNNDAKKEMEMSTNAFKFFLTLTSKNELQGFVDFNGVPLFNHSVSFYDGNTGEVLGESFTDENGVVLFPIEKSTERVFAKVRNEVDNPGVTIEGDEYVKVSNLASAFLEISSFEVEPISISQVQAQAPYTHGASGSNTKYTVSKSTSSTSRNNNGPSYIGLYVSVAVAALVGSFLGTVVTSKVGSRRHHAQVATTETEILKVDTAERV